MKSPKSKSVKEVFSWEPKAKGTSRASKPRKSAATSTSKAGAKAKPGAKQRRDLGDWREETLARMRALILEADPEMIGKSIEN